MLTISSAEPLTRARFEEVVTELVESSTDAELEELIAEAKARRSQ
jgi:hypothetical protein